jgi:hypothetical protein
MPVLLLCSPPIAAGPPARSVAGLRISRPGSPGTKLGHVMHLPVVGVLARYELLVNPR